MGTDTLTILQTMEIVTHCLPQIRSDQYIEPGQSENSMQFVDLVKILLDIPKIDNGHFCLTNLEI